MTEVAEKFKPKIMAFDVETEDDDGPSLAFYRPDFRVTSAAFSWFTADGSIKRSYHVGEEAIRRRLAILARDEIPLVCHNLQFEWGVVACRFPEFPVQKLLAIDTQRLVQCYDNGGKDIKTTIRLDEMSLEEQIEALEGDLPKTGLGLQSAASRVLGKAWQNHKEPYHKYLRETHGVKKGQEGKNLHLLTPELMEGYNTADTDVTLMLWDTLTKEFERIGYDWKLDHHLHRAAISRLTHSKVRGIRVERERLLQFAERTLNEQQEIILNFHKEMADPIASLERKRKEAWINGPKTDKGRANRAAKAEEKREEWQFNPRSTTQLADLFVGECKKEPQFFTKENKKARSKRLSGENVPDFVPKPSFRAAHLPSYGEGGEILSKLKKRQIVEKQARNLWLLSVLDGRWHSDLRACGTKTNRYTGGSSGDIRLNIQALGRKEEGLMRQLIPNPGRIFVSIDLSAGEPTVVSHYSQDKNFISANFGMVGKEPYYDEKGVLQIDDMYLMGASVSPTGRAKMRQAFCKMYDGLTFAQQWVKDPEVIKQDLKTLRAFHKIIILALMYGLKPAGMVNLASDNGYVLSFKDAKMFHKTFWDFLFPGVRDLSERLQAQLKMKGALINAFGYRMQPERESLSLNYMIQSSVSGVMKVFETKLFWAAKYAEYVTTIHDETIAEIPVDKLDEFREDVKAATDSLNKDLGWTVKIRTGFAPGADLFAAK